MPRLCPWHALFIEYFLKVFFLELEHYGFLGVLQRFLNGYAEPSTLKAGRAAAISMPIAITKSKLSCSPIGRRCSVCIATIATIPDRGIEMSVQTSPNPIYLKNQACRHGHVEPNAWKAALEKAHNPGTPKTYEEAVEVFKKVREFYWPERLRLAAPGEFNEYNKRRITVDNLAPIGPDSFSLELHHIEELKANPQRALDPTNLWETFRRQYANLADFRWISPASPWAKDLSRKYGDPLKCAEWPRR